MAPTYISSGALSVRNATEAIGRCQSLGISHLELASGLSCTDEQWASVMASSSEISFLLHNYFPAPSDPFVLNVASSDKLNLKLSLDMAKKAIQKSSQISAPFYSMHAGFAHVLKASDLGNPEALRAKVQLDDGLRGEANARFLKSVRLLGDFALSFGVKLLIENNVVAKRAVKPGEDHGLLLVDASEIVDFFNQLNHPNVGLLADVGHAFVSARTLGFCEYKWLEKVMPHIGAFHLSENDGENDSNQTFSRNSWFLPTVLKKNKIPRVIEAYNINEEEIIQMLRILEGN